MTTLSEQLGVKQPKPWKSKLSPVECAGADQIVGVEIETENVAQHHDWYSDHLSKLWEVKTDGSLRGRAYEFVSKPVEIKILIAELADFFLKTGFNEENYNDRCSIHVHTNITDMTAEQVGTLFLVYSVVEDVLFDFVNFYKVDDTRGKYRDTNIYCVPWNQCRMNHQLVQNMFTDANYAFKAWQKYTSLNILPARTLGTVEWRHMHGTSDMDKLSKWLNLIGSIMAYSKRVEFETAMKTIKTLNDSSAYQLFFQEALGDSLPYTEVRGLQLARGVVDAKYALMGLKSTKATIKTAPVKPADPFAYLNEMAAIAGDVDIRAWGDGVPEAPPEGQVAARGGLAGAQFRRPAQVAVQPAQANPQRIPRQMNAAQRAEDGLYRMREAAASYPLERAELRFQPGGLSGLGIVSADGRLYRMDGRQAPAGAVTVRRSGMYVEGFGPVRFHNYVLADFRPVAAPQQEVRF